LRRNLPFLPGLYRVFLKYSINEFGDDPEIKTAVLAFQFGAGGHFFPALFFGGVLFDPRYPSSLFSPSLPATPQFCQTLPENFALGRAAVAGIAGKIGWGITFPWSDPLSSATGGGRPKGPALSNGAISASFFQDPRRRYPAWLMADSL